jgi:hypothetical protein
LKKLKNATDMDLRDVDKHDHPFVCLPSESMKLLREIHRKYIQYTGLGVLSSADLSPDIALVHCELSFKNVLIDMFIRKAEIYVDSLFTQ